MCSGIEVASGFPAQNAAMPCWFRTHSRLPIFFQTALLPFLPSANWSANNPTNRKYALLHRFFVFTCCYGNTCHYKTALLFALAPLLLYILIH
jgi:hypothetical protein